MSTKTGKVTKVTASASGASATIHYDEPPPNGTNEPWNDPPDKVWDVLVAAYTKGSDVDVTYDDSTSPPTKTAASAK